MGDDPRDQPRNHPYDVDWFRKSHLENVKRRGRLRKAIGRISFAIDSSQGLLIGLLSSLIIFGTIGIVVAAFYLGPAAFVGVLVGLLGGLVFVLNRKVGGSLQFGDYGLLRKMIAEVLALGLSMGLLLFLFFGLPRLIAFHPF